jgi:glutathione S-transferase
MNTLITVPFSHFCEKARWALDWCRVPYREQACLPGMHLRHTRRAGGRTVPVLLRDGAAPLVDSTEILQWADAQAPAGRTLYPVDATARAASERLEDDLDERLGPATRLWAYAHGLRNRPLLRALVAPSFPSWLDRAALKVAMPFVGRVIERQYGATMENGRNAEATIVAVFDELGRRLEQAPYLDGERFGAADLTFGALGGPMLLPKEHPSLASDVEPTLDMRSFIERLRATRAGEHATRLYREHRR